jgi:hypothetical protein
MALWYAEICYGPISFKIVCSTNELRTKIEIEQQNLRNSVGIWKNGGKVHVQPMYIARPENYI